MKRWVKKGEMVKREHWCPHKALFSSLEKETHSLALSHTWKTHSCPTAPAVIWTPPLHGWGHFYIYTKVMITGTRSYTNTEGTQNTRMSKNNSKHIKSPCSLFVPSLFDFLFSTTWAGLTETKGRGLVNSDTDNWIVCQLKRWAVGMLGWHVVYATQPNPAGTLIFLVSATKKERHNVGATTCLNCTGLKSHTNTPSSCCFGGLEWASMQSATKCSLSGWSCQTLRLKKSTSTTTDCPLGIMLGFKTSAAPLSRVWTSVWWVCV